MSEEWQTVTIPWDAYTNKWSDFTGGCHDHGPLPPSSPAVVYIGLCVGTPRVATLAVGLTVGPYTCVRTGFLSVVVRAPPQGEMSHAVPRPLLVSPWGSHCESWQTVGLTL